MFDVIAFFGGTFSPPHRGHVHAARVFYEHVKPNKFLIIPTAIPPHKSSVIGADDEDRLAMCRLAFRDIRGAEVSDIELLRGGKSYTADTIAELKKLANQVVMLIGTDMFLTLDTWYHPDFIFDNAEIYCVRREGDYDIVRQMEEKNEEYFTRFGKKVCILTCETLPMSSTEIREGIRHGMVENTLPPAVADYIRERGLYQ